MKVYTFTTLFCILSWVNAFGQIQLPAGKHEVNGNIFNVGYTDITVVVWNDKNIYPIPAPIGQFPPMAIRRGDMRVDTLQQQKIIKEIVKSRFKVLKEGNQWIRIKYIFNQSGEVMNVIFSFPHGALLTLTDVAEMDRRLRQELKATFRGVEYRSYQAIPYGYQYWFK